MALNHARPGEVVPLLDGLEGVTSDRTSALVKSDRFEAVRLVMPAGTSIAPHRVDGFITLLCLEGEVLLVADAERELRPGDWLYLERGASHGLHARADSILLLHILFDR